MRGHRDHKREQNRERKREQIRERSGYRVLYRVTSDTGGNATAGDGVGAGGKRQEPDVGRAPGQGPCLLDLFAEQHATAAD